MVLGLSARLLGGTRFVSRWFRRPIGRVCPGLSDRGARLRGMSTASTASQREPATWSYSSRVDELDPTVRYRDVLGVEYSYDATVPNHKALLAEPVAK